MQIWLSELRRRKVFRVAAVYLVASWLLLQIADVLASILELPPWAGKLVFFVLVVGFLPAMILAWAYDLTPDGVAVTANRDGSAAQGSKATLVLTALVLLLGVAATGWWYSGKDLRWASDVAIPQVEDYVEAGDLEAAYALALKVEETLPGDRNMAEIWSSFSWKTSIPSSPPGARVYRRPYENPEADWQYLGVTPIYDTRIPFGASVLRFEAEGLVGMRRVIGGGLRVGAGVSVIGIDRVYDQFVAGELRAATMSQSRADANNSLASRLDKLLGNPDQAIGRDLQAFFSQLEALNRDPTSAVNRQQLLNQGRTLGERFAQIDTQLNQIGNETDVRLREGVNEINSLAKNLALINDRISSSAGGVPNDLLNEQDRMLGRLAELVDFNAVRQENGGLNVQVGSGQPLVLGVQSFELSLVQNEFDGARLELASGGRPISNLVSGGELAGLLAFRNDSLDPSRRELGQLALGLTEVFNAQHRQGVDYDGALGEDFFNSITATAAASANNSGSAPVNVTITDTAAVEARDYILRYTGSNWELLDAGTGGAVSSTGSGSAADPLLAEGLSIVAGAGAASGDRYLVSAVNGAATQVGVALGDPAEIAVAAPVSTAANQGNLSNAGISTATVDDVSAPNLLQNVSIVFDDPNSYRILDGTGADLTGPQAYTSGADISFNGWTVQVSGSTLDGDRFDVSPTGAASGDNGNGLQLAGISTDGFFANGTVSLANLSANLVANAGAGAA
ncbi:MAG: flagellar hook-associated protein FlgK, partial [Gammaproteobacteria bacterium]|nr:flagellar hook-associated protein FlgK [Gammaproteobacteria bacterium]